MKFVITNILSNYEQLSHPASIRSNQEPLTCGTVMKLGWTPTVNGARLCVLTSTFKGKECERFKLDRAHHSVAPYFSLPELMGNASCLPLLFTKPRSNPKISITTSHWTGHTHSLEASPEHLSKCYR